MKENHALKLCFNCSEIEFHTFQYPARVSQQLNSSMPIKWSCVHNTHNHIFILPAVGSWCSACSTLLMPAQNQKYVAPRTQTRHKKKQLKEHEY